MWAWIIIFVKLYLYIYIFNNLEHVLEVWILLVRQILKSHFVSVNIIQFQLRATPAFFSQHNVQSDR